MFMLLAQADDFQSSSLLDRYPWLPDFIYLFLGFGILLLLYYMFRTTHSVDGFTIHIDEQDITFQGNFPPHMQAAVIDFLRNDCQIPGAYQIRGRWDQHLLVVVVKGETALPLEQRIRNFLKLNLKPPGRSG
jgi:hypothetical protein